MILTTLKSTSRRQGWKGDRPSERSRSANLRADAQKLHQAESQGESAQHDEAHPDHWGRVNVAVVQGKIMFLPGEICQPKPLNGGGGTEPARVRPLGIMDRVIMQAIAKVLGSQFNPIFSDSSYGYMQGRSVQQAARQAQAYYQQGYLYQITLDLEKFFDTVNHDALMHRVARSVKNKDLLKLLGRFLRAGVVVNGRLHPTRQGVPQGSPMSPVLSNILLNDLDKELETRRHKSVRYADDLAIFVKSKRAGERVLATVSRYLERKHLCE